MGIEMSWRRTRVEYHGEVTVVGVAGVAFGYEYSEYVSDGEITRYFVLVERGEDSISFTLDASMSESDCREYAVKFAQLVLEIRGAHSEA